MRASGCNVSAGLRAEKCCQARFAPTSFENEPSWATCVLRSLETAAGTATGTYSGALAGYSTGDVYNGTHVTFTATTVGNKTDLTATGTGAAPTFTIVNGTAGVVGGFSPATSANLANVIGILKTTDDSVTTMADAATTAANYCVSGDIDASMLYLPIGVTLDTVVGSKSLKDILTSLGFHLNNVTEMTKFDN